MSRISGLANFSVLPADGFVGVIATEGSTIDRITYTPPSGFTAGVDDFRFGIAQAQAPEPGAMALLGIGVGMVARRRYRRRGRAV